MTSAAANVVSANGGSGVLISGASATSNLIAGNFIGTDLSATIHLGNGANGVKTQDATNNTIGGTAAGAGNTIAFNGHNGVLVDTGAGNAILSHLIFDNGNLGIELINNGNNNQAAPLLLSAVQTDHGTQVVGMLPPQGSPTGILFNTSRTGFNVSEMGKTGSSQFLFATAHVALRLHREAPQCRSVRRAWNLR